VLEYTIEPVEEPLQQPVTVTLSAQQQPESAGLSVSALNADRTTEIAMVTANC